MLPPPEIWIFIGINVFIMLSLITHRYTTGNYSGLFPSIYQIIALEGVAQMYLTNFFFQVGIDARNLLSVGYFTVTMANVGLTLLVVHKRHRQTGKTNLRKIRATNEAGNIYALKDLGKDSVPLPQTVSEPVKEISKAPRRRTTPVTNEDRGESSEDLLAHVHQYLKDAEG